MVPLAVAPFTKPRIFRCRFAATIVLTLVALCFIWSVIVYRNAGSIQCSATDTNSSTGKTLFCPARPEIAHETQPEDSLFCGIGGHSHISQRLLVSDVTAATFSESNPVHEDLFGPARQIVASTEELEPYVHPRIIMGKKGWNDLLTTYVDPHSFNMSGTWSKYFRDQTIRRGPDSDFVKVLAELERNGSTLVYTSRPYENSTEFEKYRKSLKPLADRAALATPSRTDDLVFCTLWASVAQKQEDLGVHRFLPRSATPVCVDATVAWSKIMLSHRTYYCNPDCPRTGNNTDRAYIWNTAGWWSINLDWFTGGTGMAFTYDYLYDDFSEEQGKFVRSAIAMAVLKRNVWGTANQSSPSNPNVLLHPHRAFSNWAGYNSNLYLTNLAIEGETDFDEYALSVLSRYEKSGFNEDLNVRYSNLLEQFMLHSFYPDGSTFEDGYSYFTALREGSLGLLALHRRNVNVLETSRFKNIIHNAVQMHEPWQCGDLIGHGSGGGNLYNAYVGLFRYVFPYGEITGMLWRQRFGMFQNNRPCRIHWFQTLLQLAFLGGEHSSTAESPAKLSEMLQKHFKLSYYSPRRGLLIARSSLSERATYMHFDARPDAFLVGHDNADRGVFTFSALRQTWLDDLAWQTNVDSRKHSLFHIDGLAQDLKAPSVKMLKVEDHGDYVLATADLTYAYNVQWSPHLHHKDPFNQLITVYNESGVPSRQNFRFIEKELSDPWTLGWPEDDRGEDTGFTDSMTLHGLEDVGFTGIWLWKRRYRTQPLNPLLHVVRSAMLVRPSNLDVGYGVVVDSVSAGPGTHVFESYLILQKNVEVDVDVSGCFQNQCKIVLKATHSKQVDLHISSLGPNLSFRKEIFSSSNGDANKRLIVKSVREDSEEFWMAIYPNEGAAEYFELYRHADGTIRLTTSGDLRYFKLNTTDLTVVAASKPEVFEEPEETIVEIAPSVDDDMSQMGWDLEGAQDEQWPIASYDTNFENFQLFPSSSPDQEQAVFFSPYPVLTTMVSDTPEEAEVSLLPTVVPSLDPEDAQDELWPSASYGTNFEKLQLFPSSSPDQEQALFTSPYPALATMVSDTPEEAEVSLLPTVVPSLDSEEAYTTAEVEETPLPEAITRPMNPKTLKFGKVTKLSFARMNADKESYFRKSDAIRQEVFTFSSHSNDDEILSDLFTTCFNYTTAKTEMFIYDCGARSESLHNYGLRECFLWAETSGKDTCTDGSGFSHFAVRLQRWKVYFLVISVYRGSTARPRFFVRHQTLQDNSQIAASTSSPSPSKFFSVPMQPRILSGRRLKVFARDFMSDSRSLFLHDTNADFQMVFKTVTFGDITSGTSDVFTTCSRKTTVATEVALYDCGEGLIADENYRSRKCRIIGASAVGDKCARYKTKYLAHLQQKQTVYLVVSMYLRPNANAILALAHRLAPSSR